MINKLTRLVLKTTEKDVAAMFYITSDSLSTDQRAFLAAKGVTLTDGVYDYTFPAFYEERDVSAVRQRLGDSCVAPPRARVL